MYYTEWNVLVVDDEPDVQELTQLVMRDFEVEGVPVNVHTASSKEQALTMIKSDFTDETGQTTLAVAFIDVVMETDNAGLELCQAIRHELQNAVTQIYIRTGQPGIAPEREVIDKYDINGYFTKVEATEDKLYTLVKSGVRQFMLMEFSVVQMMMLNGGIATSQHSAGMMSQVMTQRMHDSMVMRSPDETVVGVLIVGDEVVMNVGDFNDTDALAERDKYLDGDIQVLSPEGDGFVRITDRKTLFIIAESPNNPESYFLATTHIVPTNPFFWYMIVASMRSLAMLYSNAKQGQTA